MSSATSRTSPADMLHVSNAVTYAAIFVGLVSVAAIIWWHNVALAGAGIALSVVLDTLDGRFARRFERTPEDRAFGVQLDSLADAVNSGFVPVAVVTTMLWPTTFAAVAWLLAAFFYLAAVVTRLGYYNITHEADASFTGMPAPVAALIVSTLLLWSISLVEMVVGFSALAGVMLGAVRIVRPKGVGMALFLAWPTLVLLVHLTHVQR